MFYVFQYQTLVIKVSFFKPENSDYIKECQNSVNSMHYQLDPLHI